MATCYATLRSGGLCERRAATLVDGIGGKIPACRRHAHEYAAHTRLGGEWAYAPRNARFSFRVATGDGYTYHDTPPHKDARGVEIVCRDRKTGDEVTIA